MTRTDWAIVAFVLMAFVCAGGLVSVLNRDDGPHTDPNPVARYIEVEVPDRLIECVVIDGTGVSCNWSDPLSAVSSLGPIERVADVPRGTLPEEGDQ